MKNIIWKMIRNISVLFFAAGIIITGILFYYRESQNSLAFPVYAKEDEAENEYGDEKEYVDENNGSSSTQTIKTKIGPIYETIFVTKVITTIDQIFKTDEDGDGLVDGLDPHPTVHEREYFTDDDDDGIPNAFDMYRGDDDFAYYEGEKDENEDGILDSYEFMAER
jgi:hypothetical protein